RGARDLRVCHRGRRRSAAGKSEINSKRDIPGVGRDGSMTGRFTRRWAMRLSILLFLLTAGRAARQDQTAHTWVVALSGALRSGPGGELIGNVRRGIPVTVSETSGDWARVTVEGWMRRTDIAKHEVSAQSAAISSQLQVKSLSIQTVQKDKKADPARI